MAELWGDDDDDDPYAYELRVRQARAWWPVKASNSMDRYLVPIRWVWLEKCWVIEWRLYKKDKWEVKWRGLPVFKPNVDLMSSFYKELYAKYPGLVHLGHEHWSVQEWHTIKNSPYGSFSIPLGPTAASGFSGLVGFSGFSEAIGLVGGPGPGASGSTPPGDKEPPPQEDDKDRWDSI